MAATYSDQERLVQHFLKDKTQNENVMQRKSIFFEGTLKPTFQTAV